MGSGLVDDSEGAEAVLFFFSFSCFDFFYVTELNLVMLCCELIYKYKYMVMIIEGK